MESFLFLCGGSATSCAGENLIKFTKVIEIQKVDNFTIKPIKPNYGARAVWLEGETASIISLSNERMMSREALAGRLASPSQTTIIPWEVLRCEKLRSLIVRKEGVIASFFLPPPLRAELMGEKEYGEFSPRHRKQIPLGGGDVSLFGAAETS